MKILFLDIDGVVNCKTTVDRVGGAIGIDAYKAFMVGKIQLDTGCEVVLSSSWRNWPQGVEEIEKRVVKLAGSIKTVGMYRGEGIERWLEDNPGVTKYAILDDSIDMLAYQAPNFFRTTWDEGLTEEIAKAVTDHLNGE